MGSEDNKGVHRVFRVFVILGPALHELDNDLRSAIAKREKIDMDGKVGESAQRL